METPDGVQTPQDFVYKTKIVVLNYLGFGPPSFDMPSSPGTESDTGSALGSLGSDSGEEFGLDDDTVGQFDKTVPDQEQSTSGEKLAVPDGRKSRSKSLSPRPANRADGKSPSARSVKKVHPVAKLLTDQGLTRQKSSPKSSAKSSPRTSLKSSLKRRSTFEMHEQYQVTLRELLRAVDQTGGSEHIPKHRHSWDTSEDWHIQYRRAMDELIESVQAEDEIHHSPQNSPRGPDTTMHEQFQKSMQELRAKISPGSTCDSESSDLLCPLSREAIVAERIAQIGDRIMETHGKQLEQALRNVMDINDGKLSYALFKAVLKETIQSHVPGWYHLAVTLNFTRHLALGLLWSGNSGIESVSDFATRYIEENLAEAILDQGGWEAITCINLDDIDDDSLSGISSGGISPYTADVSSTGSQPSPPSSCSTSSEPPLLTKRRPSGRRGSGDLERRSGYRRASDWKDRRPSLERNGSNGSAPPEGVTLRGLQQRELNLKLENLSQNQKYMRRKGNMEARATAMEGGEETVGGGGDRVTSGADQTAMEGGGETIGGGGDRATSGTDHPDSWVVVEGVNGVSGAGDARGDGVKANGDVGGQAGSNGRVDSGTDGGEKGHNAGESHPDLKSWIEHGKVVAASAALAGITVGMYALMRR